MAALGLGQGLEPLRDLGVSLFARGAGHARVHLRVLVGLAFDGGLEVLPGVAEGHVGSGIADRLQEVHVAEGVAGLRFRRVTEEATDLRIALDVGGAREVEVAAVRLALEGEGVLQVLVGLASLEGAHVEMITLVPTTVSWAMPTVIAPVDDLMFLSRIREAAKGHALEVKPARTAADALAGARAGARPAIRDLDSPRLPVAATLAELRGEPSLAGLPVVGFFSHVEAQRGREARQPVRRCCRALFVQARWAAGRSSLRQRQQTRRRLADGARQQLPQGQSLRFRLGPGRTTKRWVKSSSTARASRIPSSPSRQLRQSTVLYFLSACRLEEIKGRALLSKLARWMQVCTAAAGTPGEDRARGRSGSVG